MKANDYLRCKYNHGDLFVTNAVNKINGRMHKSMLELAVVASGLSASRAFTFITSIIIARASGSETFGQFSLFTTIFLIISEVPNAIDTTYIRLCNNTKSSDERYKYFSADLLLKIIIGSASIAAGFAFSPLLAVHVFDKPESIQLIRGSVLSGALYSIYLAFVAYHQQMRNFVILAVMRGTLNLLVLITVGALFVLNLNISIYELATAYISIITLMTVGTCIYNYGNIKIRLCIDRKILKKYIEVCALLITASLITLISNRLDVFFITSLLDYDKLGLYNVAIRIALIIAIVTGAIRTIALPSAASAVTDKGLYYNYIRTSLSYIAVLLVIAVSVIVLQESIIHYTFGDEYLAASDVVTILVCQAVLSGAAVPFVALIQCGPYPRYTILLSLVKLILGAVLLSLMIPSYGIYGASLGITLATTATLTIAIIISTISRPAS